MRSATQELEFVERTEKDVIDGLTYLIDNGYNGAVNRVLDLVKQRTELHKQALEIAKEHIRKAREKLQQIVEVTKP